MKSVGFIGAGNMARALAHAIAARFPDITIHASDVRSDALDRFQVEVPASVGHASNADVATESDVVFVAVKPQMIAEALEPLSAATGVFVSIAAGVRLSRLEKLVPRAHWVRVMPNTPCLVGQMAAGFTPGANTSVLEAESVAELLASAGVARQVDEGLLDAVTGLAGSGPAFVARLIEAFVAAGVSLGLPEPLSSDLATQTFRGTAELLLTTGMSPDELVEMVSSPNGTTVAGRDVLEGSDVADVIGRTIRAASERSKELGT